MTPIPPAPDPNDDDDDVRQLAELIADVVPTLHACIRKASKKRESDEKSELWLAAQHLVTLWEMRKERYDPEIFEKAIWRLKSAAGPW